MVLNYSFDEIPNCEMCGSLTQSHKVLGQRLNQSQGLSPRSKHGISVSIMKCTDCGLIYSNPMPIPRDIQDHYGVPPETYWNNAYFNYDKNYFTGEIRIIKELLDFKKGMTALDIGAGLGKCMISLENAGFDAHGLEPSLPFYEKAQSLMKINPSKLKLGMVEELDYDAETFDFISYGAVFEHLYHPARCLERSLKWLKKGGILHVEVPSSNYLIPKLINFYFRLIGTSYVNNLSPMHNPFHLYEFTLDSFKKLGNHLGFTIEKDQLFIGEVLSGPKFLHPILKKYMTITKTGMQLTVYLRKNS
jgi:2-polyprenyl-3-methyl-5-hydroxy-6-metoxy-1,4-benzoquinol methylase